MSAVWLEMDGKNIFFIFFLVLLFGAFLLFAFWMIRWQYSKADRMLVNWATQHKYKLIEKQDANFGDGPLGRRGAKTYVKYRIKVEDAEGKTKTGIVYLGSENVGVLSEEVKVEWDN